MDHAHRNTRRPAYPLAYVKESEHKPQNVSDKKKLRKYEHKYPSLPKILNSQSIRPDLSLQY